MWPPLQSEKPSWRTQEDTERDEWQKLQTAFPTLSCSVFVIIYKHFFCCCNTTSRHMQTDKTPNVGWFGVFGVVVLCFKAIFALCRIFPSDHCNSLLRGKLQSPFDSSHYVLVISFALNPSAIYNLLLISLHHWGFDIWWRAPATSPRVSSNQASLTFLCIYQLKHVFKWTWFEESMVG